MFLALKTYYYPIKKFFDAKLHRFLQKYYPLFDGCFCISAELPSTHYIADLCEAV